MSMSKCNIKRESGRIFLGIDFGDDPSWSVKVNKNNEISRYQQVRKISKKRARKLRKRGEYVFWWPNYNSFCWYMWRYVHVEM